MKNRWVILLKTEKGVYIWSKYQNEYFWGGSDSMIRFYNEMYYAVKLAGRFSSNFGKVEVMTEREFTAAWLHQLTGKDLILNGLA